MQKAHLPTLGQSQAVDSQRVSAHFFLITVFV